MFQGAKHLITFHNKKRTVVIQPNMKHSPLQCLHNHYFSYLFNLMNMKSNFPFQHLPKYRNNKIVAIKYMKYLIRIYEHITKINCEKR